VEVVELTHNDDTGKAGPALHAWSTLYDYDANDQLTRRTDAQGNVLTIDFDGLKRRTHLNDPERGEMFFGYDAASNLTTRRDARQQQVLYAYDGVNRLISEDYLDDGASDFSYGRHPEVRYHYDDDVVPDVDQGDGTRATFHNGRGHVTWIEDVTGEEHFDYDDRGRTVATVKRVLHPVTGRLESYRTGYRLDVMGRLLGLVFPDGDEVAFTFNERSLVSGIAGAAGVAGEPVVPRIRYAPSGQRTRIDFANGVTTGWRYDARLRVERWTTGPAAGPEPWLDYRHTFDAASNLIEVEDLRSPSQAPDGDPRRNSRRFSYDDLHRLLSVRYSHRVPSAGFTAASGLDYAYDRVGSRLATTGVGAVGTEVFLGAYTYGGGGGTSGRAGRGAADPPGPQALTQLVASGGNAPGVSWTYDANGNVRSNGIQRLTWDFLDRLVRVEGAEGATDFRYDHAGTRVWKRFTPTAGEAEVTLYPNRYFEVRDAQQPVKYVWDSEHRVARVVGTLSAGRSRVQRLRLVAGWNLVSAAVDVAGGWESNPGAELVTGLLQWSLADLAWSPVAKGAAIPAGTVLWVQATAGGVLGWSGLYHDPPALGPGGGPGFLPGSGLEALPLDALWDGSASIQGWIPGQAQWWQFDPAGITTTGNRPKSLPPGSALFLGGAVPGTALEGRPLDRMHFYVADHVESTTLITDLAGGIVEEVALHPFGEVRHRWSASDASPDPYLFVHKERDRETGFDNFGARLLASQAGRFLSVDPVASGVEPPSPEATELFWKHPQMQAAYAYAGNNPLRWVDRMGRDITTPLGSRTQTKQADGSVVVDVKGVKVTVLQDTTSKDVPAGKSATTGPEMKVRVVNGKVSVQLFLQTKYKDGVDPTAKSAYGRGTTDDDKKAGNTSLKFHESQHGVDFLEWLEKNPFPVADGATITKEENSKLRDKIKEWKEKFKDYTEKKTDCVGNKEPGCP
jgi:RHS repeat-associated protein